MANFNQVQDLAASLKLTGSQMGRIAEDDLIFRAAVDSFRAEDAGSFGKLLERFELKGFCEEICRWFCVKECVIECIELAGPPRGEFTQEQVPEFAHIIARITRDEELVERLAAAIADRDAEDYRRLVAELKIEAFAHVLCMWACSVRCGRRCEFICGPLVTTERQHLVAALTDAGTVIAKLAEDKALLKRVIDAAVALNCRQLEGALSNFTHCTVICRWICSWRCVLVCLPLTRAFPPGKDLSIEEERHFALALARLAAHEDALPRLLAAVQARNSESFAALIKEYKFELYAIQLCAWLCHEVCTLFCYCVCPPPGLVPMFTQVGVYNVVPSPNDFNPNGTTKAGALAFTQTIPLNGLAPDGNEGTQDIEYRFTIQQILPTVGGVTNVTGNMIAQTQIGELEYSYWNPFHLPFPAWEMAATPVYVNHANPGLTVSIPQQFGPPLTTSVNVIPDANGWIILPRWNDNSAGAHGLFKFQQTLANLDTTKVTLESFDLTVAAPPLPLLAGDAPPHNVLSKMPVYKINFEARDATTLVPVGGNSLDAIALSNTSYTYNRHPDWPGAQPPVTSPLVLSVDIVELAAAGGCSELIDTIYGLYTAYHPYLASCDLFLQGPNVASMVTPPSGLYTFNIQPNQGQVIGTGNGATLTFNGVLSTPVLPGSVRIVAGSVVGLDNGIGSISGAGISSGTVNYVTGAINVTYSVAPAAAVQVRTDYDTRVSSGIPPSNITVVGTGNGANHTFSNNLTTPVMPGTVRVTVGGVIGLDDEAGNITGVGISAGSINYATGAISVTLTVAPAMGIQVVADYDNSTPPLTPFDMSGLPKCAYILWLNATLNLTNGTSGVYGTFSDYIAFCTK